MRYKDKQLIELLEKFTNDVKVLLSDDEVEDNNINDEVIEDTQSNLLRGLKYKNLIKDPSALYNSLLSEDASKYLDTLTIDYFIKSIEFKIENIFNYYNLSNVNKDIIHPKNQKSMLIKRKISFHNKSLLFNDQLNFIFIELVIDLNNKMDKGVLKYYTNDDNFINVGVSNLICNMKDDYVKCKNYKAYNRNLKSLSLNEYKCLLFTVLMLMDNIDLKSILNQNISGENNISTIHNYLLASNKWNEIIDNIVDESFISIYKYTQ